MQVIKKAAIAVIATAAVFSAQQVFAYSLATAKKVCKKGYHANDIGHEYSCNTKIISGTPTPADAKAKPGAKTPTNGASINPTGSSPVSK